jgi:hypothetical protein
VCEVGKQFSGKKIEIIGEIVPDVNPTPRVIHLGRQTCGVTREESVRLDSLTGQPFRVKGVIVTDPDVVAQRTSEPETPWLYSLSVRVSRSGEQRTTVKFVIEEEPGTEYTLEVPILYQGITEGGD